jgi:hypothetical protein
MPDQALAKRYTTLPAPIPPAPAGSIVQTTIARAQQTEQLITSALGELDKTYRNVEAFVSQPGRSYHHQRWIQDKSGYYLGTYEIAVRHIVDRGIDDILAYPSQATGSATDLSGAAQAATPETLNGAVTSMPHKTEREGYEYGHLQEKTAIPSDTREEADQGTGRCNPADSEETGSLVPLSR